MCNIIDPTVFVDISETIKLLELALTNKIIWKEKHYHGNMLASSVIKNILSNKEFEIKQLLSMMENIKKQDIEQNMSDVDMKISPECMSPINQSNFINDSSNVINDENNNNNDNNNEKNNNNVVNEEIIKLESISFDNHNDNNDSDDLNNWNLESRLAKQLSNLVQTNVSNEVEKIRNEIRNQTQNELNKQLELYLVKEKKLQNAEIELLNEQLTNHGHVENNNILNDSNDSNDFNRPPKLEPVSNVTRSVNGNNNNNNNIQQTIEQKQQEQLEPKQEPDFGYINGIDNFDNNQQNNATNNNRDSNKNNNKNSININNITSIKRGIITISRPKKRQRCNNYRLGQWNINHLTLN